MPTTPTVATICVGHRRAGRGRHRSRRPVRVRPATRSGISKDTLTRALGGGSFKVVDLAQVADVLGRTPPEWFAVAEQPR